MMRIKAGLLLVTSFLLGGCGLTIPAMEGFSQKTPEGLEENTIINQVKCELHLGVQEALARQLKNGNQLDWLRDKWGAKVTMNLTVDEKGTLAPGLSFTSPFEKVTQTFTANLGATASAQATRKEAVTFSYGFKKLLAEPHIAQPCSNEDGILIHSDLKIAEFVTNKALLAQILDTTDANATGGYPFSSFSDDVTFVVAVGATATPTFKLVRFSANSSSPLVSAARTKTQDILVTLSPLDDPNKQNNPKLNAEGLSSHDAELIGQQVGQAVANSLRAISTTAP